MTTHHATPQVTFYGNPPKSLIAWANRHADKIREVGDERGTGDGYWVYLRAGFSWDDAFNAGPHSYREDTINDVIQSFGRVGQCRCKDCVEELSSPAAH